MKFLEEVYKRNKVLDQLFIDKYESVDKDMYRKNKLELLVEIGELANESKCFKYWTKKEVNRELMLLEFADCTIMTLCLFNYNNLELLDKEYKVLDDASDQIAYLYKLGSELYFSDNKELLYEILFNLVNLGKLLNITKEEIVEASIRKINLDIERM